MTYRALAAALVVLLLPAPASAQKCQDLTVQEQWYQSINELVYLYAGEIASGGPGRYTPFRLRVLVGTYRPPFLLPRAHMREPDLNALLQSRPDITQSTLDVGNPLTGAVTPVSYAKGRVTVRVLKVTTTPGGADSVVVQACR
jgi:hypothetical protein